MNVYGLLTCNREGLGGGSRAGAEGGPEDPQQQFECGRPVMPSLGLGPWKEGHGHPTPLFRP